MGLDPGHILIEPEAKNTAPVILAASLFLEDPESILLVVPSDHVIPNKEYFHKAISIGLPHVRKGNVVTFGIKPKHPETGYGYLELANDNLDNSGTSSVVRFVEKPSFDNANKMIEARNFLWNAGIFLFKAKDMIKLFKTLLPDFLSHVTQALHKATSDLGFVRLDPKPWTNLPKISIDYGIIEKAPNIVAVPYLSKWSDLGSWSTIWSEMKKDSAGNATSERAHTVDCKNTLLRSENSNQQIVGLGLENIIAVSLSDAVLVSHKDKAQDVNKVVDILKTKNISQAEILPIDYRPWGWFENLAFGDGFKVKRIHVKAGGSLSLQSHLKRSEHWIVVEGKAKITIDDKVNLISKNQSVYVPLGAIHRIENPNKSPLVLIEVQIGSYLGEDDITRYEDVYKRN